LGSAGGRLAISELPPMLGNVNATAAMVRAGIPVDRNDPIFKAFSLWAAAMARYHAHEVLHLERLGSLLRRGRRVVLVGNHVLDMLDPLLFTTALIERYGTVPCFIGHENLVFRFPGLGRLARSFGMIPSRRLAEASAALRRDRLLMLYPGSGSEAARRSYRDEPYRLKWENRLGFLRLALRNDAEVVFVAAVGIDEMYYQSNFEIPVWYLRLFGSERYRGSRFQFGLLGPHMLPGVFPLPVRITHVVSKPFDLGDRDAARRNPTVLHRLHARIWKGCQRFLDAAVAAREADAPLLDRTVRGGERLLQRMGL
jgi:1-acyl-sn-glycerol-3-phosphate acyltransferase